MWTQRSIWHAAVAILVCAACRNSNFCPGANLNNNCFESDAAPQSCGATTDCPASLVCDLTETMTCVECTRDQAGACSGKTPSCGPDHTCQECVTHADCASAACLPDGTCGDDMNVAYVASPGGVDNPSCTKLMPCAKVQKAIEIGRPYVKLAGTLDEGATITIDSRNVTLLADPDAKLTRTNVGIILEVKGTSQVSIYDLEITGALGAQGIGISVPAGSTASLTVMRSIISGNQGGGISTSAGALTVMQSTISGNQGGGISIAGGGSTFSLINNFITRNGDELNGAFGGLSLGIAVAGNNRLEFNTIVDNKAVSNSAGVVCTAMTFNGPNNIIARNSLAGNPNSPSAQTTAGGCTYPSSIVQADAAGLMFVHPDPPGKLSYKLMSSSSAIDQATTPSDVITDNEGDARPSGSGKDIGADEYK